MNYLRDNIKISKIVIICLYFYLLQSVFFLILCKFIQFSNGIMNIVYNIDRVTLLICGIVFLIWQYRISLNHDLLSNKNSALKNIFFWLIPFVNSFLVFDFLKRIYVEYSCKNEEKILKYNPSSLNKALYIWFLFFVLMYVSSIYISGSLPFNPDDIDIYYALNPNIEFYHRLIKILIDTVGIFSIVYVIKAITELENNLLNANRKVDIINHLVIEE